MIVPDEFLDAVYQSWANAKHDHPGDWFWSEEENQLRSLTEDGDQVLVLSGVGEKLGMFLALLDRATPDLVSFLRDLQDKYDALEVERDQLVGEVAELAEEVEDLEKTIDNWRI